MAEWADRHRILSSRAASEAGPYRTSRTPYLKAIMEALSPNNPAQRVVFMKSAQVGATEAGNNWIGFCIHRAPGPILAVQPTTDLAKRLAPPPYTRDCGESSGREVMWETARAFLIEIPLGAAMRPPMPPRSMAPPLSGDRPRRTGSLS